MCGCRPATDGGVGKPSHSHQESPRHFPREDPPETLLARAAVRWAKTGHAVAQRWSCAPASSAAAAFCGCLVRRSKLTRKRSRSTAAPVARACLHCCCCCLLLPRHHIGAHSGGLFPSSLSESAFRHAVGRGRERDEGKYGLGCRLSGGGRAERPLIGQERFQV